MKTISTYAPLATALLLAFNAAAQDHTQHTQHTQQTQQTQYPATDHSQHQAPVPDHSQHAPAKPDATPKPPPAEAVDHSAMGHDMPAPQTVDHAAMGHDMPRPADQPLTPIPVPSDEDRAAAVPPSSNHAAHDDTTQYMVMFNRLEAFDAKPGTGLEWEGQAWFGKDLHKLWLRSEGERTDGHTEAADLEVLYGRPIAPWWDVVAGVRHDFKPGRSEDFLAVGVMGLAPYKFEVSATAYLGESGQTAARMEAEYETLLTNRLILQPLVEVNLYGKNDAQRGIGSGVSTAEIGLRLRYEIRREFAPYIGVVHERAFGRTADFRRDEGEDVDDTRLVAGVRVWF